MLEEQFINNQVSMTMLPNSGSCFFNIFLPLPSAVATVARADLRNDDRRLPNSGSSSIAPGIEAGKETATSIYIYGSSFTSNITDCSKENQRWQTPIGQSGMRWGGRGGVGWVGGWGVGTDKSDWWGLSKQMISCGKFNSLISSAHAVKTAWNQLPTK